MAELKILKYPHKCLRTKTLRVTDFGSELRDTLKRMTDVMYIDQGIGLAGPQVGISKSILVVDIGEGPLPVVNPRIVDTSEKMSAMDEGCLSLPGINVRVSRPESIRVIFQDAEGEKHEKSFNGLYATALQHEIDHLKGRLIIDYLDPIRSFITRARLRMHAFKSKTRTCEVSCNVRG
jgi:peptide deformylase